MIHELKILPEYFGDILSGEKTFEIRKHDRNYEKGDFLALNEYTQDGYTGRCAMVEITYILSNTTFLPEGFCCMSFKPCGIRSRARDFRFAENPWTIPVYGNERNKENG